MIFTEILVSVDGSLDIVNCNYPDSPDKILEGAERNYSLNIDIAKREVESLH
jgi:hypothetical protein